MLRSIRKDAAARGKTRISLATGLLVAINTSAIGAILLFQSQANARDLHLSPGTELTNMPKGALAIADVDADGKRDAIMAGESIVWFPNTTTGGIISFGSSAEIQPLRTAPQGIGDTRVLDFEARDLDADGDLDFAYNEVVSGNYQHSWLIQNRTIEGEPTLFPAAESGDLWLPSVRIGWWDLDSDGDLDPCFWQPFVGVGWTVNPMIGGGDPTAFNVLLDANSDPVANAAVSDFDGDGDPDIVATVVDSSNSNLRYLVIFKGAPDGDGYTYSPSVQLGGSPDAGFQAFSTDLNGDTIPDYFIANNNSGSMYWFAGQRPGGDFTLATKVTLPSWLPYGRYPLFVDLDGDGDLDVYTNTIDWKVRWVENRLNAPSADFDPGAILDLRESYYDLATIAIGDLDGDGIAELIAGYINAPHPYLFGNEGTYPRQLFALALTGSDSAGFTYITAPPLQEPVSHSADDGLWIRGADTAQPADTIFAFWSLPHTGVFFQDGLRYRITCQVASTATEAQAAQIPTFRMRVNSSSLSQGVLLNIDSRPNDVSQRLPIAGQPATYSFWVEPTPEMEGEELQFSFDYLYTGPLSGDDARIAVGLEGLTITAEAVAD